MFSVRFAALISVVVPAQEAPGDTQTIETTNHNEDIFNVAITGDGSIARTSPTSSCETEGLRSTATSHRYGLSPR